MAFAFPCLGAWSSVQLTYCEQLTCSTFRFGLSSEISTVWNVLPQQRLCNIPRPRFRLEWDCKQDKTLLVLLVILFSMPVLVHHVVVKQS